MNFTLSNYIESITNPNGRFRELEGLYPITDQNGNPLVKTGGDYVAFRIMYAGEEYLLRCFNDHNSGSRNHYKEISVFAGLIESPFTVPYSYYEEEMLVFDNQGNSIFADVAVEKIPQGMSLRNFIQSCSGATGVRFPARELLSGFSGLSRWMLENEFSHNCTNTGTIWISPSASPLLTDYSHVSRGIPVDSIRFLGLLSCAVYIAGCEPVFLKVLEAADIANDSFISTVMELKSFITPDDPEQLRDLFDSLSAQPDDRKRIGEICDRIGALADCGPVPMEHLLMALELKPSPENGTESVEKPRYQFVGELCDMLIRAFDGKHWYYLDRCGKVAIPGPFTGAEDFSEGRALVETETGFGLIDRNGTFILEPEYDDIYIDEPTNMVVATLECQSGIFTREGESVTGLIYEQIMSSGDGLFPVRKNGRYGYIRKDGSVVVEMIYEDAFGFRYGTGRVALRGREYLIDTEGNMIEEILEREKIEAL